MTTAELIRFAADAVLGRRLEDLAGTLAEVDANIAAGRHLPPDGFREAVEIELDAVRAELVRRGAIPSAPAAPSRPDYSPVRDDEIPF